MTIFARRAWIALVLTAGLSNLGCARLSSFTNSDRHPMLGSTVLPEPGSKRPINGDLYAQRQSRLSDQRKQLLASSNDSEAAGSSVRSTAHPSDPESLAASPISNGRKTSDLAVALEPPVALTSIRDPGPAPAADESGPQTADARPRGRAVADRKPDGRADEPRTGGTAADAGDLDALIASAKAQLDAVSNYQVLMTRQERVGAALQEPEQVLLSVRREPKAVRLEWPKGPHKGREVIYSASENGGLMHINMADSALPMPRVSMPPDSPMVLRTSRHPITEAGYATILANLEKTIECTKRGVKSRGTVAYEGLEREEALEHPSHKIVRKTPDGETWIVYLDPETKLPALVQATNAKGELLERYLFATPQLDVPELASADAFSPNARWGEPKGLLSRLSRAGAAVKQNQTATR